MRTQSFIRTLLPMALTLALAGTAIAAPPEKESPMDKETSAQQTTPPLPPQSQPATTQSDQSGTARTGGKLSETDRMKSEFNARDANMDGYIDKKEASMDQNLAAQFKTLDTNNDGKLSATEFMNAKNIAGLPKPKSDTTRQ